MDLQKVIWGLEDLADKREQERVWLGRSKDEMSSFIEAISMTFDDSGLSAILACDKPNRDITPEIREMAIQLSQLINKVPQNLSDKEIIELPAMDKIREVAANMLKVLKDPK